MQHMHLKPIGVTTIILQLKSLVAFLIEHDLAACKNAMLRAAAL